MPWGTHDLLLYIHKTYKKPIYVTEFGFARKGEKDMSVSEAVQDADRIEYFKGALDAMRQAVQDGADLRGCFAWSKTSDSARR